MQSCLPSACLLCCILVPMVGTVPPFYQRENVWQQFRPYSDNLFSLSSGNVWQDQPSWNPPRPFHTGNIWHQEPFSDSSASIYSGGAWQQWPSLDSPSPVQPRSSRCYIPQTTRDECEICKGLQFDCSTVCPSRIINPPGRQNICERNIYIQFES